MAISPNVVKLIDQKLAPLIRTGCRINHIKMVVAEGTELVEQGLIQTSYGVLRVVPGYRMPPGRAYLIEDRYKGFAWVR